MCSAIKKNPNNLRYNDANLSVLSTKYYVKFKELTSSSKRKF